MKIFSFSLPSTSINETKPCCCAGLKLFFLLNQTSSYQAMARKVSRVMSFYINSWNLEAELLKFLLHFGGLHPKSFQEQQKLSTPPPMTSPFIPLRMAPAPSHIDKSLPGWVTIPRRKASIKATKSVEMDITPLKIAAPNVSTFQRTSYRHRKSLDNEPANSLARPRTILRSVSPSLGTPYGPQITPSCYQGVTITDNGLISPIPSLEIRFPKKRGRTLSKFEAILSRISSTAAKGDQHASEKKTNTPCASREIHSRESFITTTNGSSDSLKSFDTSDDSMTDSTPVESDISIAPALKPQKHSLSQMALTYLTVDVLPETKKIELHRHNQLWISAEAHSSLTPTSIRPRQQNPQLSNLDLVVIVDLS
jgi:hypothetical protein